MHIFVLICAHRCVKMPVMSSLFILQLVFVMGSTWSSSMQLDWSTRKLWRSSGLCLQVSWFQMHTTQLSPRCWRSESRSPCLHSKRFWTGLAHYCQRPRSLQMHLWDVGLLSTEEHIRGRQKSRVPLCALRFWWEFTQKLLQEAGIENNQNKS